jgi:hypothetical protein
MERKLELKRVYRHFKGMLYYVSEIGIDSETEEEVVIYKQLYPPYKTYVRPLDMFLSTVDREKYPDVKQKYRFELVEKD